MENKEALREQARRELERRRSGSELRHRSTILPVSRTVAGDTVWTVPGLLMDAYEGAKSAVTLPRDVLTGKVPMYGPDGHISDEVIGRSFEGAMLSAPMNPAARLGDRAIPGLGRIRQKPVTVEPPSAKALHEAADEGYGAVRGMDVKYAGGHVGEMARKLASDLFDEGFIADNAPVTNKIISDLQKGQRGAFTTPALLDAARKGLNRIQPGSPDHAAAQRAIRGIDEFIMGSHPPGTVAGTASPIDAGRALADARGNYAAAKRSDQLTGIEDSAGRRAAAVNSGLNLDNSIRSRIASLLDNNRKMRGFTEPEEQALESLVRGNPLRNSVRATGNVLGGGGGLGAIASGATAGAAGSFAGGPVVGALLGLGAPAVGVGAKLIANALTKRALGKVDKNTRRRSPLHRKTQDEAPLEAEYLSNTARGAALRAIMFGLSENEV